MSYIIALAGKGGVGKTTIAALIVKYLLKNNKTPVLAIDADPNSNFSESLGIDIQDTIGSLLSGFMKDRTELPAGMTKQTYLELKMHQILKEGKDMDMMAMGMPEGPGCYCAANSILKDYFEKLISNYKYIVVDNEAGMEHFSRKNNNEIDLLVVCSNYSRKGVITAKRLSDLVDGLGLNVKERALIVNQTPGKIDEGLIEEIKNTGLPFKGSIEADDLVKEFEIKGKPVTQLPEDSKAYLGVESFLKNYIN